MRIATTDLRARSLLLLAGDFSCFVLFALLGLRSHEDGITAVRVIEAAAPFQAGWLLIHLLPAIRREQHSPAGVLMAWVPAWAVGLALRTLVLGREFAPTFAGVSLLFNAALLLLWRTVIAPRVLGGTGR